MLAFSVVLVVLLVWTSPLVAAANNSTYANNSSNLSKDAPYYVNSSRPTNGSAWFAGHREPSMDNITGMAARVVPRLIGFGNQLPGGVGYAGPVVLGLVVTGIFAGAVKGVGMSMPSSAVVSLVGAYGLIDVGLAPPWLKIVILMLLGVVASIVVLRISR